MLCAARAQQQMPLGLFPTATVWTATLPSALASTPAFDDRLGFFPLTDGHLATLDLATGEPGWTLDLDPTVSPIAGDGLLFAATDGALSAYRTRDGTRAWTTPLPGPIHALLWKSGWLIAASTDGTVRAFRADDGALLWQRELAAPPAARLTVAGARVYLPSTDGRVLALGIEDGADIWQHHLGGAPGEVVATDDRVYVGSVDNHFYCLDAANGRELWRWRTGGDIVGAAAIDERHVYFASLDNILRALDRRHGAQRWKRALGLRPSTGPVLAGVTLIVSGRAPSIEAFAAADGQPTGGFAASGDLSAPPRVMDAAGKPLPLVIVSSGRPSGETTIVALMRTVEPRILPIAPLPGLVQIAAPAP